MQIEIAAENREVRELTGRWVIDMRLSRCIINTEIIISQTNQLVVFLGVERSMRQQLQLLLHVILSA